VEGGGIMENKQLENEVNEIIDNKPISKNLKHLFTQLKREVERVENYNTILKGDNPETNISITDWVKDKVIIYLPEDRNITFNIKDEREILYVRLVTKGDVDYLCIRSDHNKIKILPEVSNSILISTEND
jgi:hypothetical protein